MADKPLAIAKPPKKPKPGRRAGRGKGGARQVTMRATKIEANGTRVPLGVVSAWHRNPIVNAWLQVKVWLGRRRRSA